MQMIAAMFYGLVVIASGMLRYFGQDGGETGLWFGIVMGSAALIAAASFWLGQWTIARILAGATVVFVGGWFFYEALIKKGFAQAEPRQLIVIAVSCVFAIILFLPQKKLPEKKS